VVCNRFVVTAGMLMSHTSRVMSRHEGSFCARRAEGNIARAESASARSDFDEMDVGSGIRKYLPVEMTQFILPYPTA
jgi:hypothetical protein